MVKSIPVNANAAGDNQIVAAVPGRQIRVLSLVLAAAGDVDAKLQSGSGGSATDLTGALPLVAGSVVSSPSPVHTPAGLQGQFETDAGERLNLNLSGAVQVSGWLTYLLVTA